MRLEVQASTKVENKEFTLVTSKLHYLEPRISVAWYVEIFLFCLKNAENWLKKFHHFHVKC
jgi:hypothetical protein